MYVQPLSRIYPIYERTHILTPAFVWTYPSDHETPVDSQVARFIATIHPLQAIALFFTHATNNILQNGIVSHSKPISWSNKHTEKRKGPNRLSLTFLPPEHGANEISFETVQHKSVIIRAGCDVHGVQWTAELRVGARNRPSAVKSPLGWIAGRSFSKAASIHTEVKSSRSAELAY